MTGALDAYASKDYTKAYALFDQSHNHMFMAGAALGQAIAKQMPNKFPTTGMAAQQMPATGVGTLAHTHTNDGPIAELALAAMALLALGGLAVARRHS